MEQAEIEAQTLGINIKQMEETLKQPNYSKVVIKGQLLL